MFIEFIYQIYAGCTNPMEYIMVSLLFYIILEFIFRLIGAVLNIGRR